MNKLNELCFAEFSGKIKVNTSWLMVFLYD